MFDPKYVVPAFLVEVLLSVSAQRPPQAPPVRVPAQAPAPREETPKLKAGEWMDDYAKARAAASELKAPLLIVVGTEDCVACRRMAGGPLGEEKVKTALRGFVCLKLDANKDPATARGLGATAYPTVVMGGWDGKVHHHAVGYQTAEQLLAGMGTTVNAVARNK